MRIAPALSLSPLVSLALSLAVGSCSDSGLLVLAGPGAAPLDNLVTVEGTYCLDPPEETSFPLKIVFVIDSSGSMQFTDPTMGRVTAVEQAITSFLGNPSVSMAIVRFNEGTGVVPSGGFTNDLPGLLGALDAIRVADSLTNYQAALAVTFELIAGDIAKVGPAELARTRYIAIFLSDGTPDPRCTEGCSSDGENPDYAFCNDEKGDYEIEWADYEPCEDYNQDFQILQKVSDLMALGEAYGVGDLRVHTALLFDPNTIQAAIDAFGIDPVASRALLEQMAKLGNGTFRDFSSGESIDYLSFDLQPIFLDYALRSLLVANRSALPTPDGFVPDTDGDGLADADEAAAGSDPRTADTDADGYLDGLEWRMRGSGWDALDAARPGGCGDPAYDEDGDGLTDCAEERLLTDRTRVDTDGDGLPDGAEALAATDPTSDDADGDLDFDGVRNGEEIRLGMDPRARDGDDRRADLGYRYAISPSADPGAGEGCFDFAVRGVSLVTTLAGDAAGSLGWNDLRAIAGEGLAGSPADAGRWTDARACAQFIEPDYKNPADGLVKISAPDFGDLWAPVLPCAGP